MSELQHPKSRAFEQVADLYERRRPSFPEPAVAWLVDRLELRPGRTVLDLGAGTGKLTRLLVGTGARVIAVEPGDAMRARLVDAVPAAEALAGAAEAIPLADSSVDAVTVAQAFHWFRPVEAIDEICRVLRPRGGVALVWNQRDRTDELHQEIERLVLSLIPMKRLNEPELSWRALEQSGRFGEIEKHEYPFADEFDADALAERMATISGIAAAPEAARAELDRKLRRLVAERGGRVRFPYICEVYACSARAEGDE